MVLNQRTGRFRHLFLAVPLACQPVLKKSKRSTRTGEEDSAMRATGFTKFFQVIQVSSNRRLADPKRFAEVRNRDEPGTSDQLQKPLSPRFGSDAAAHKSTANGKGHSGNYPAQDEVPPYVTEYDRQADCFQSSNARSERKAVNLMRIFFLSCVIATIGGGLGRVLLRVFEHFPVEGIAQVDS